MNTGTNIQALMALARDTSRQGRRSLLEALGDLFAQDGLVLSERERALMTDILRKLVGEVEQDVRARLSACLAPSPQVPPELVQRLAHDAPEVAAPVLMHSPVLHDAELIAVVQHRTQEHQLAVAQRVNLSEAVSNALVETGDDDVIALLLRNNSAAIAEATTAYLSEQAKHVDKLQEPLISRSDLSPDLARRLYWYVSAVLRRQILEKHNIAEQELDDALESVVHDLSGQDVNTPRGLERRNKAAWMLAERIEADRGIDTELILKVLRAGETVLFEALFGRFSGIRPPRLQTVLHEPEGKMLAVVARALGIAKSDFVPLFLLTRRDPKADDAESETLWRVLDFFAQVPEASARQVLRRWQRHPEFVDAIEQIEEQDRGAPPGRVA